MSKNPNIAALNTVGQSIWYDNCSRDVLQSGTLARYIEAGVSGLTSNPTIFKKAIADTSDYDHDIAALAAGGTPVDEICEELMVQDVGAAADLLRPIYEETEGADGYASIEVSPFLADDTAETFEAVNRLWKKLDRPNVMVKIPATPEGLPAIENSLRAGININITLIFSVDVYREVAKRYITALEQRKSAGEDLSPASVASFFVSRVDSIVERELKRKKESGGLDPRVERELSATVGIANSRLAYREFRTLFGDARFEALAAGGARVQRPLWASTSTKNPDLPKLLYVEQLAGADTVNTLPPETLETLLQGADVQSRVENDLEQAAALMKSLDDAGISFSALTSELRDAGVKSFADSYRDLLAAIEQKIEQIS